MSESWVSKPACARRRPDGGIDVWDGSLPKRDYQPLPHITLTAEQARQLATWITETDKTEHQASAGVSGHV